MTTRKKDKGTNVLSISGGKDSTAMLIAMLENNDPVHWAIFVDTTWEFPAMIRHIDKLEKYTGVKIWRLHSTLPLDYWLSARPITYKKGERKGEVRQIGRGWPTPDVRWCTAEKIAAVNRFIRPIRNPVSCVGIAADESHRIYPVEKRKYTTRYPLVEYGITEKQALRMCYNHGFDWEGLYRYFNRSSCFCCPLQPMGDLRTKRKHFPEIWQKMLHMENTIPNQYQKIFKYGRSLHEIDAAFQKAEAKEKNKKDKL